MVGVQVKVLGVELELYKDEGIQLVSKAIDYEKVGTNWSDYSQGFTIPATPRNNSVFKHYYNPLVINGFDPFATNECKIYLNGQIKATGVVRIVNIKLEMNKPQSYSIQFFSDTVNLTEKLKDKTIADINWSIFDHVYTVPTAGTYLSGTGISAAGESSQLFYPFISTRSLLKWDNPNALTYKKGVSFASASGSGVLFDEFRPAATMDFIMRKLFELSGFEVDNKLQLDATYNSIYLWLHNGEDYVSNASEIQRLDAQIGSTFRTDYFAKKVPFTDLIENGNGMAEDGGVRITVTDTHTITFETYDNTNYTFQVRLVVNGVGGAWISKGTFPASESWTQPFTVGDYVIIEVRSKPTAHISDIAPAARLSSITSLKVRSANVFSANMVVSKFVPKLDAVTFIQGVLDLFNALIYWDNANGKFIIQNRLDWLNDGNEIDITKYVDSSKTTLKPPTFYNSLSFEMAKGNDASSQFYLDTFLHNHGSTKYSTGNIFGKSYKKKVPFTLPLVRLIDSDKADSTAGPQAVYQLTTTTSVDKAYSKVDPNLMMFIKGTTRTASSAWKITDYTLTTATSTNSNDFRIETPGTLNTIGFAPTLSANQITKTLQSNTLFKNYYSQFITEFYNQQVRRYNISAYLSFALLSTIKPNTTLVINHVKYRIEDITTDTLSGKSVLNLITKAI